MNIAAALGLDNDPAKKEIQRINRNFNTLFQLKNTQMKEKEAYRTRRDVFLRREARETREALSGIPSFTESFGKGVNQDNTGALMLLLGGGLLAAAAIGAAKLVKKVKDWVKDVQKYLYEKFNIFGWSPIPRPASEIEEIAELPNVDSPTGPTSTASPSTTGDAGSISPAPDGGPAVPTNISANAGANKGAILSKGEVNKLARKAGFSAAEARIVVGIAGGESGRDPSNSTKRKIPGRKNLFEQTGEDSVGLMQINWGYHKSRGWLQKLGIKSRNQLFDPLTNLKAAHWLYKQRGNFHDWTVYTKGYYKRHMQQGGIPGRRKMMNSLRNGAAPVGASKAAPPSEPTYGVQHLIQVMDSNGIKDKNERAMFLAQMHHESGGFKHKTEIADGKKYEPHTKTGKRLGNTQVGDGPKYKGRGYIQLTGRWNYDNYGKRLGLDMIKNPELAASNEAAGKIAVMFWNDRVNRKAAQAGDVKGATLGINPKLNGLKDRAAKFEMYKSKNYNSGGKVAPRIKPKRSPSKINNPAPKVKFKTGGRTPTDSMLDLHTPEYTGNMIKKRHMRRVVVINTPKPSPTSATGNEIYGGAGPSPTIRAGNSSYFSETAKRMYRVQKGAFT